MKVLVQHVEGKPHAQAGQVLDLPDLEAQDMIRRGAASAAPDAPLTATPEPTTDPLPALEPEPEARRLHARKR